jgi:DHA2 family multidrug resistance protein
MADDPGGRQRPFDFLGFGTLITFIGALQLMLDRGPGQDWFDSKEIWVYAALCLGGLWMFVMQTLTAPHPFFHRDLAKDGNYVTGTTFGLFVGVILFSTSALLPSFMQNLLGYSALEAGWASMTRGLGSLIAFLAVPVLIVRFGARKMLVVGVILSAYALWMMCKFDLTMTSEPIMVAGFIQGIGTGLLFAPLNLLSYATLSPVHRTEGTIVATMARSLGSSLGISVVQAAVIRDSALIHARLAERMDPSSPMLHWVLPSFMNPSTPGGLALLNAEITRQGAMVAYDVVFAWMALGVLFLLPLIMILRPPPAQPALSPHEMAGD